MTQIIKLGGNMKTTMLMIVFVLLSVLVVMAQLNPGQYSSADCKGAILINAEKKVKQAPPSEGFGKVNEVQRKKCQNDCVFEKEHHTVWYRFYVPVNSTMTFEVIPESKEDDYDFILFQKTSDDFCSLVASGKAKPLRSNISRNDTTINGVTGLSTTAKQESVLQGPNDAWSRSVDVTRGDEYYLVLDNVYENGKGYSIEFTFYDIRQVAGIVLDDSTNLPVEATVTCEDGQNGKILAITTSDIETGEYQMDVPVDLLKPKKIYSLSAMAGSDYFFEDRIISGTEVLKVPLFNSEFKIPRLIFGKNYRLNDINFYGGMAIILPESKSSLRKLKRLMENSPELKILIEGHTNGVGAVGYSLKYHINLSNYRAMAVQYFLTTNHISEERLKCVGFGCSKMLYPKARNEHEMSLNRRVETKVIHL